MGSNILLGVVVVMVICIFWVWNMLANHPKLLSAHYDDLKFKTGDIILFHAYDNVNPVFIGCYWGHVGIVYDDPDTDDPPMLFEAAKTTEMSYCPDYNKHGIMITDLKTRVEKYPGLIACKFLNRPIDPAISRGFKEFIYYARNNMYYYNDVVFNGMKKKTGERIHTGTNCGEITLLSLIKLGLIPYETLDKKMCHHLLYVINLTQVENNHYMKPIEVTINPF